MVAGKAIKNAPHRHEKRLILSITYLFGLSSSFVSTTSVEAKQKENSHLREAVDIERKELRRSPGI